MAVHYDDYGNPYHPIPARAEPGQVDWSTLGAVALWLFGITGWLLWFWFLLIPTIYGLHGTTIYPIENNIMFVLTGLVLAITSSSAWSMGHGVRSAFFAFVILILSYWF